MKIILWIRRRLVRFFSKNHDKIVRDHAYRIISGHYAAVPDQERIKVLFNEYIERFHTLAEKAPKGALLLRDKYIEEKNIDPFMIDYIDVVQNNNTDLVLLFSDVFTDPFPSSHDMEDWALYTRATDILLFAGYFPGTDEYFIQIKNHFVNHEMFRGLLRFNIYKKI